MTPPGSARRPGRGPEGPWDPQNGGPDPHFGGPRCTNAPWGMVITRVTDYRGGACLARILSTLEDNVHLAHLLAGDRPGLKAPQHKAQAFTPGTEDQ